MDADVFDGKNFEFSFVGNDRRPPLFLMGRLRVFSLKRPTVGAFAVPFRVLSRQKYDTGTISQSTDFFLLSHSLLIRCIRQLICCFKIGISSRGANKFQELAHKTGSCMSRQQQANRDF